MILPTPHLYNHVYTLGTNLHCSQRLHHTLYSLNPLQRSNTGTQDQIPSKCIDRTLVSKVSPILIPSCLVPSMDSFIRGRVFGIIDELVLSSTPVTPTAVSVELLRTAPQLARQKEVRHMPAALSFSLCYVR